MLKGIKNPKLRNTRGFTLLLASLVVAIVLAVGASIFEIAQKELTLSSIGRDSQFAFYAADTAAECALYWDVRFKYFATTPPTPTFTCDGQTITATGYSVTYPYTVTFQFEPNGYCAEVAVEKTVVGDPGFIRTFIRADGFSTDCAGVSTNPRTLQRSVELRY